MKKLPILTAQALLFIAAIGRAQGTGSVEAAELFKQGRAALEAKNYAQACPRLAESLRLERATGTLISLAECEQASGRLASARQHWEEAADFADATQDKLSRGSFARERLAALDPRVPRLTIRALPGATADMMVKRDDVELSPTSLGSPFPVDPGTHVVVVTASGRRPKTYELKLDESTRRVLDVEPGVAVAAPVAEVVTPADPQSTPQQPAEAAVPDSGVGTTQRIVGYSVVGLGVVGVGIGAVLGFSASSSWSKAQDDCKTACGAESTAQREKSDAASAGTASTIAFVTGGAALAGGIIVVLLAPKSTRTGWSISPSIGGLAAAGTF